MGYGPLAHFKGPSSFLSRIIPDLSVTIERMYVNISNQLITENEWLTIKLHMLLIMFRSFTSVKVV